MRLCHRCDCHVFTEASACPHCGASLPTTTAPRPFKFGVTALSAGLLLGCTSSDDGDTDPNSSSDTMTTIGTESTGDGDGDGDMTATGTSTTNDTQDATSEAAYGIAEVPCDWLDPEPAAVGDNPIVLDGDFDIIQTCSSATEAMNLYAFTAEVAGIYEFSIVDTEFEVALSTLDQVCVPVVEQACARAPYSITEPLEAGTTVHIVVGSEAKGSSATLSIVRSQ